VAAKSREAASRAEKLDRRETAVRQAEARCALTEQLAKLAKDVATAQEALRGLEERRRHLEAALPALEERDADCERREATLAARESEILQREAYVRTGQSIIDAEVEAARLSLAEAEAAVEAREHAAALRDRHLSVLLAKERLLERMRIQSHPRQDVGPSGGRPRPDRGSPTAPGRNVVKPEKFEDPTLFVLLDAETRIARFSARLFQCLQSLRRCSQVAFTVAYGPGGRSGAPWPPPTELSKDARDSDRLPSQPSGPIEHGPAGPTLEDFKPLSQLTELYRECKEHVAAMVGVLRSASLSLLPTLPPPADPIWPDQLYAVEPILGHKAAAAQMVTIDSGLARRMAPTGAPEPMGPRAIPIPYTRRARQPKKLPSLPPTVKPSPSLGP